MDNRIARTSYKENGMWLFCTPPVKMRTVLDMKHSLSTWIADAASLRGGEVCNCQLLWACIYIFLHSVIFPHSLYLIIPNRVQLKPRWAMSLLAKN